MSVRLARPDEIADWDSLVTRNPDGGTLYQAESFGRAKTSGGWAALKLIVETESHVIAVLVLERRIPVLGRIWYSPTGPGFGSAADAAAAVPALREFARARGVFLVKLESELLATGDSRTTLSAVGLVKCADIQPISSTIIIDLVPSLDDILAGMPKKGRYAIRKAAQDGVTTAEVPLTDENMRVMYALLSDTGRDAGFAVRPYEYYAGFWSAYGERDQGRMFFAWVEGAVVAGAFTGYLGHKAWYKDGASIRDRTAYGASHALQWQMIQWHKARGVATTYDMMGAPPSDRLKDETHPLHGVGVFKTSLNPVVTDRVGTYELVVRPRAAAVWRQGGYRLAAAVHRRTHHENFF